MQPRRTVPGYRPPVGRTPVKPAPDRSVSRALPGPVGASDESSDVPIDPAPDRRQVARKPSRKAPAPGHRLPVSTKLEPAEMQKLDRIAARVSRADRNRSAALRWLVQQYDEGGES